MIDDEITSMTGLVEIRIYCENYYIFSTIVMVL